MSEKKYVGSEALIRLVTQLKAGFASLTHTHKLEDIADYTVDAALSSTSTNPVQNKVVNSAISSNLSSAKSYTDSEVAKVTSGTVVVKEAEHASSADSATTAITATNANHAATADSSTTATSAESATKATQDASGNVITETYETKSDASAKLTEAKSYADSAATTVKNDLLNGAGTAYDTLKELGDLIDTNVDAIDALETVAASKADASALTSHTSNKSNPHGVTLAQLGVTATAAEVNIMDGVTATAAEINKLDGLTATTAELNYVDGVTSNIQSQLDALDSGKADTHSHPYAGSSTQGGSATSAVKLDSSAGSVTQPVYFSGGKPVATTYSLNKTVPNDAVFTDTTYDVATTSAAGLMSAADKTKLNVTNIAYGTCSTAAATAAKVIAVSGNSNWTLAAGSIICVKFDATNTAENPTFNVNSTGAKSVWYGTAVLTTSSLGYAGTANRPCFYMYDGTQYIFLGWSYDANTTYTNVKLGHGYTTCSTAAATTAKTASLSSYTLSTGGIVAVKFTYDVPASATLNINSKGAKAIYHKGAAIAAGVIKAGDTATFIYSSRYHLISIDRDTYTKSEIDSALSGKSDSGHTHSTYVNQNAFSNVVVGDTTIAADSATDTLTMIAGSNVTLTPSATNDSVTIAATDTVYTHPTTAGNKHIPSGGSSGQILRWSADGTAAWGADNNTTYSAGTGISLSGTTFSNSGVRSISSGSTNGTISVNTGGTSAEVAVKGLGSAAYTASSAYATSGHTHTVSGITDLTATAAELNIMDGVTATTAEINYVDGVTSNIQTQLDAKQATITGGASTIASSNLTASRALVSNSSGKVAVSAVTSTELGYLDGVTSAIQSQLDSKAASSHTHNYAGSSSAGGSATSAEKLATARTISLTGDAAGSASFDGSGDASISTSVTSMHGITTAGTGAAYTATVSGITALTAGVSFIMIPHTNSTSTTPTLNVNSLGAKGLRMRGSTATGTAMTAAITAWLASGRPVQVTYNGIYWLAETTRPVASDLSGWVPLANGGVPESTADDNGKFLRVIDGSAAWATIPNAEEASF